MAGCSNPGWASGAFAWGGKAPTPAPSPSRWPARLFFHILYENHAPREVAMKPKTPTTMPTISPVPNPPSPPLSSLLVFPLLPELVSSAFDDVGAGSVGMLGEDVDEERELDAPGST